MALHLQRGSRMPIGCEARVEEVEASAMLEISSYQTGDGCAMDKGVHWAYTEG